MTSLFGGSKGSGSGQVKKFNPVNINAGGLTSSGTSTINVSSSAERKNLFKSLSDTFANQAGEIGALKPLLSPGFGALTEARVNTIQDRSRSAISDLSANLASRRIKGSSFGQDALSRAKAEFAKQEADARAVSFLEELDATVNLINQESSAAANSYQVLIDNMNIEASTATQLATQATAVQASIAQYNAQAAAQEAQSKGSFLGTLISTGIKAYGISQGVPA
jgi:hypothetical protein